MYDISFDDVVSQLFPGKIKLSLVHEGENRIHGFSVYNITQGLNYIWAIYKLPSGATKVDQQTPLESGDEQFDVEFPNCLLTEHGRLLVQIVATDSDKDILTIFDEYAAGTFNGIIQKSRVYEFYVNESLDALQEMASPSGGISQAVKDYIEELVEEAGGGSVDPAVLNSKMDKVNPTGSGSLSIGRAAGSVVGEDSVALGHDCTASGTFGHAEGMGTTASGTRGAHAEGEGSTASGQRGCHAEGHGTTASGESSHAEGSGTTASGSRSHAEGFFTSATGDFSHSEGSFNAASGRQSHVEGRENNALGDCQHVQGRLAIDDESGRYAHIVGNGRSIINQQGETEYLRSNAHTVDWDGNAWYSGDVRVGGSDYDHSTPLAKATSVDLYSFNSFSVPRDTEHNILYTGNTDVTCGYFTDLPEPSQRFLEVLLDAWLGDHTLLYSSGIGPDSGEVIIETRLDPNDGETEIGFWLAINATLLDTHGPKLAHFRTVDTTKAVYIFSVLNDSSVEVYTSNLHGQDSVDIFVYGTTAVKEELADVAFSGDYDDLKNKPAIPSYTVDNEPTSGSDHLVESGGVHTAIQNAVANRPTTTEMNTAIQNAIGNVIGGSY